MEHIKRKNYNFYLFKTGNFKTINVSFVFQRKSNPTDELYRTLLKKILFLKTEKYNNLEEISKASAKIYSPVVYIKTRGSSKDRTLTLTAEFANEKYTEEGMNKKNIEFIMDYFWHPFVNNGAFDKEIFELVKKNYIEELKSAKNYPDGYCLDRFWQIIDVYDFKLLSNEKLIKELEKIDEVMLYEYYASMFKNDSLDIFIAGDIDEEVIQYIDNYIYGDFVASNLISSKHHSKVDLKKVTEKTDNPQSKLLLGYKMLDITPYEEKYISLIFSMILGGGTESCLHQEVRVNRSLCYYIYASAYNLFDILLISAGISANKTDEVIDIVKAEITKLQNGILTDEKVKQVKQLYKNILLESKDSQNSIINNLISVVMQNGDDIDTRLKEIAKVTKEDVIKFAKKVKLDTIYLLEGTE